MELNCFSSALTSKACISDFMGYITAYGMGRLRIWKGWKLYTGTKVAYRGLSFRAGLANFSKTMLNRILHLLQKHGFESGQGRLQIFHRLKTFCTLWIKIWQRRARTVEQVQSHTRQEWGNITLPKVLLLMFTNYCYKKRGCYTVLSIALSQLFLDIFLEPSNS